MEKKISVKDLLMQAFLTGWELSDKSIAQDEYLQSAIQVIEVLQVEPENVYAEEGFGLPDGRIGAGCEETGDERHAAHSPAHLPQPSHASSQRPRDRRSECRFYPQQVVVGQKHGLRAIVSLPKQIAGLLHPLFEYEIHRLRA